MPPQRARRAAVKHQAFPRSSSTLSSPLESSLDASSGTTLVQALEHIPPILPKVEADSDDDLTPPPIEISTFMPDHIETSAAEPKKRKRASAKKLIYAESPEPSEVLEEQEKPRKGRKKAVGKTQSADEEFKAVNDAEDADITGSLKKKKATPKKKVENGEEGDKPKKKATPKKSRLISKDEAEFDSEGNEIVKKQRKPKVYPKIEYDILPVERKETTFKGRLGYACLNTVLRGIKPDSVFCSRTCRIASIEEEGMELPKGLALMNARDLKTMIEWNEQNKIRFMRMSSEMFPFASHAKYGYDLSFADKELQEAGELANKYGHRLTMHPGQFTQLGSPKDGVVEASVRELDYQCEIMDRMGLGADGVMIIHMGGIYGDKPSTLARFKENYTTRLSDNVKKRLVLENDEICYNVDDIMPVCEELDIPIIFDYHHDWIYPSSEPPAVLIPKIAEIWKRRGIRVKQHLSEPRPGAVSVMERRAHADRCQSLPKDLPDDVDLMIEAKDKEQAVFELYRIYGLHDVIHDNLRPADPNPGMHTKGRKSALKKKTKQTGDVDSDGNPVELSDIDKESIADTGDGGATVSQMETPKKRQKKVKVEKGIALAEKASTKESQDERMNTVQGVAAEIKEEIKEELTASKEKPKTVRKRTPKKVAKEAEPETGGEPGGQNDNIQEKTKTVRQKTPKKATKDVKKPTAADQDGPTMQEISKQVAEEIEAKMEDEAGVVIHQPEEVKKLPLKRRGRSSQAKQLV